MSGANADRKAEVKLHSKRDGVVTLERWQAMAEEVEAGDAFTITGLREELQDLQDEVRQSRELPRPPQVPGIDFPLTYPDRGKND
jgi:hypothetical protein